MSRRELGDTPEQRSLAAKQRDFGFLNPGDADYDSKLQQLWGGPQSRWFAAAMEEYPKSYSGAGQWALVTGGTSGIGFYVAKLLARCGYSLILPVRAGFEFEASGAVQAIHTIAPDTNVVLPEQRLELRSFESVRTFAAALRQTYSSLDVLCLNAGRGGGITDPRDNTEDGHEAIMQVNTISQALLTSELLPLLRGSPNARVVCQSSGARFNARPEQVADLEGLRSFNAWSQYSLSKACMCLFARSLNERLLAANVNNVQILVSEPGLSATGVNIQHDLVKSLGLTARGLANTNEMHNRAGHHAADGALPMALASMAGARDEFFCTDGREARSLQQAAFTVAPEASSDPMLWPVEVCRSFLAKANEMTKASWPEPN